SHLSVDLRALPNCRHAHVLYFFFFKHTAPTAIYTLSLHDALPISATARATPPTSLTRSCKTWVRWSPRAISVPATASGTTRPRPYAISVTAPSHGLWLAATQPMINAYADSGLKMAIVAPKASAMISARRDRLLVPGPVGTVRTWGSSGRITPSSPSATTSASTPTTVSAIDAMASRAHGVVTFAATAAPAHAMAA